MSDFDKVYDAAMAEARVIDKEARRRFEAINADPTLTLAGKQPKFAEVDAWRAGQVDALQNRIALELAGEKAALRVDIESRQRAAAKAERARLAEYPATALLLAERELSVLPSAELAQRVEGARDPLEREIFGRLALVEAQRREENDPAASEAVFSLRAATVTDEDIAIRELGQQVAQLERNGDGLVNALDRRAVATQMHNAGLIADPSLFEAV